MSTKYVTFGEVMGRFMPAGFLRLRQVLPGSLELTFGGSEANVAALICQMGGQASYVTALPKNPVADACLADLNSMGVQTHDVVRSDEGRMGLYFVETGVNQRPSQVTYDRSGATVSVVDPAVYDWAKIFAGSDWLHVSGITPAVSSLAAEATVQAVRAAHEAGLTVSCDLNYRQKLWTWGEAGQTPRALAESVMVKVLEHVDVLIANEEDCAQVLGISAADTDVDKGELAISGYPEVARAVCKKFPSIQKVGITLRESVSATHNRWGAMLYDAKADRADFAPLNSEGVYEPYEIHVIVDRVGAGDSFAASLIFALADEVLAKPQDAIAYAVAGSCLAHSNKGDFTYVSRAEVENLMGGSVSGRVVR